MRMRKVSGILLIFLLMAGLTACSILPVPSRSSPVLIVDGTMSGGNDRVITSTDPRFGKGLQIVSIAEDYLGTPYRYGGDGPSGFDCSGLVQYTHMNVGIDVPRTADDQSKIARKVSLSNLRPGDVIFFRQNIFRKISHVGIYTGNGQFIHAPKAGVPVSFSSLEEPYWEKRLVKAGRFY